MSDGTIASHDSDQMQDDDLIQLVTFRLGEEEFGVDILIVSEIIRLVQITQVPHVPDHIVGVINLRGTVLPVVGLRKRFGMPDGELTSHSRIIVMQMHQSFVGFLVDAVSEVLRIPKSTIEDTPAVVAGIGSEYIKGVGKLDERLLILLDLERLLNDSSVE